MKLYFVKSGKAQYWTGNGCVSHSRMAERWTLPGAAEQAHQAFKAFPGLAWRIIRVREIWRGRVDELETAIRRVIDDNWEKPLCETIDGLREALAK